MAALILPSRFTQQPQYPPSIDRGERGSGLVLASLPWLTRNNLASGASTVIGTPPTGYQVSIDRFGQNLMIHPAGGSNGYGGIRFGSETVGTSDDWTLIWVGQPQNYSTANGRLMARGADSAGNGWNIQFGYASGPISGSGSGSLVATVVDSSPAAFSVTLSSLPLTVDQHERVALVKRGTTIKVFNWRTRQMASASAGNGALRTSTLGIGLGLDTNNDVTTAGHSKVNTALAYSSGLSDADVWALLDNPWLDFRAPTRRLWVATASGGATDTPVNPNSGALKVSGFAPTLAATVNQTAAPSVARAAIAGYAPTLARTANLALTPANAGFKLAAFAPTLTQTAGTGLSPAGAGLEVNGYAPSILQPNGITANVGAMEFAGYAPTLTQAITTTVAPGGAALELSSYAPSLVRTANISASPGLGSLEISSYAPALSQSANQSISMAVGQARMIGHQPAVVQAPVSSSPSIAMVAGGALRISGMAPTLNQTGGAPIYVSPSRTVNFDGGTNRVNFDGGTNRVNFDGGTNRVDFQNDVNGVNFNV